MPMSSVRDAAADPALDRLRIHAGCVWVALRGDAGVAAAPCAVARSPSAAETPPPPPFFPSHETSRPHRVPGTSWDPTQRTGDVCERGRLHGDPVPPWWRNVTAMTTNRPTTAPPAPTRPTRTARPPTRCAPTGCAATAVPPPDRHGLCRKCYSRALWSRDATPAAAPTPTGRPPAAASPGPPAATPGTSDDQHPYQEGDLAVIVSVSLVLLLGLLSFSSSATRSCVPGMPSCASCSGFTLPRPRWAPTSTPRPPP